MQEPGLTVDAPRYHAVHALFLPLLLLVVGD